MDLKILRRPRRNRRSGNIRRLVRETVLGTGDLVWPVFVHAGVDNQDIASMPGVVRYSVDSLVRACAEAQELGIPAVGIFPAIEPSLKDPFGTHGLSSDNLLYRAICEIKRECPELVIMADVALVGFGYWGRKLFKAASNASSGIVVRCVVDADPKALDEALAPLGRAVASLLVRIGDLPFTFRPSDPAAT